MDLSLFTKRREGCGGRRGNATKGHGHCPGLLPKLRAIATGEHRIQRCYQVAAVAELVAGQSNGSIATSILMGGGKL